MKKKKNKPGKYYPVDLPIAETDDQKIEQIIISFEEFAFVDIEQTLETQMVLGTFILCTCVIDQLSNHRYHKVKGKEEQQARFSSFVRQYFPKEYDADQLYHDLRSRLIHNYSVSEFYSLAGREPEWHLAKDANGKIWLNVGRFFEDILAAWNKFKLELIEEGEVRKIALKHYNKFPVIRALTIHVFIPDKDLPDDLKDNNS